MNNYLKRLKSLPWKSLLYWALREIIRYILDAFGGLPPTGAVPTTDVR